MGLLKIKIIISKQRQDSPPLQQRASDPISGLTGLCVYLFYRNLFPCQINIIPPPPTPHPPSPKKALRLPLKFEKGGQKLSGSVVLVPWGVHPVVVQNSVARSERRNGGSKGYFAILAKPHWNRFINFINTVEPRCKERPRDWKNIFAKRRISFIVVLFRIFYYYWGEEYRSSVR